MTQENHNFDFSAALKALQEGKPLLGKGDILTLLIKNLTATSLEGESDSPFGQQITANPSQREHRNNKNLKW